HPEWATDPRFVTNAERRAHREQLIIEMERVLTTKTKGEWIDILEDAGVPCAPIQDLREMLAEPQTAALGVLQAVPGLGVELMTPPVSFGGERPPIRPRRPPPGRHPARDRGPGLCLSPSALTSAARVSPQGSYGLAVSNVLHWLTLPESRPVRNHRTR